MSGTGRGDVSGAQQMHLIEVGTHLAHPLAVPVVRIGRDTTSDVLVRDATVSRLHAELRATGDRWTVHVLGSTGATVNGARVDTPIALATGDILEIGSRRFTLHEGELPAGIMSYVERGHDPLSDPLLSRTTQSNPVVDPNTLSSQLRGTPVTNWTNVLIVALAFALGCGLYLAAAPR